MKDKKDLAKMMTTNSAKKNEGGSRLQWPRKPRRRQENEEK